MADPTIDEIKRRLDVADLISQSVQLKKRGRYLTGLCPFHQEKTPSFVVYPEQGTFHCFGCQKSGDVFTWVQETERLDFGEALRRLAARAGVALPERAPRPPDPEAQAAGDALSAAAAWYHEQLLRAPDAEAARRYLASRGLKRATVERFGLGWAPDRWDALATYLQTKGFSPAQLVDAGLAVPSTPSPARTPAAPDTAATSATSSAPAAADSGAPGALHDRFRGRVLFPIRDAGGKVCGFGGRVLGAGREGQPKYLNSPQTRFFDKSATLFALDLARPAIRQAGCAVIVEGYLDVVVPHQEGFQNVVASLGTALTERQIELLKRYTSTIVLALDADAAGQAATLRGLEVARQALSQRRRPVPGPATRTGYLQLAAGQLKIATLQGGKDPDEIVRDDPVAWRRLIESAVPMVDHKLAVELAKVDPADPQSKSAAVQELARFLAQVPDQIEWAHYVDRIAQRLRLDVRTVREAVARAARALRQEERRLAQREATSNRAATSDKRQATRDGGPEGSDQRPEVRGQGAGAEMAEPRPSGGAPEGAGRPREGASEPGRAESGALMDQGPAASGTAERDVTEEHLVSLLVLAPQLVQRMPARLAPEDFRQPECRELYRTVLRHVEGKLAPAPIASRPPRRAPEWPAPEWTAAARTGAERLDHGPPDDPFRPNLDAALRAYYDAVVTQARRRPPQTASQLEADLAGVVRRIKERNLRQQLLEAQYLLAEADSSEERLALQLQVERLAAQLGRVQLERSRASLYTSPPS